MANTHKKPTNNNGVKLYQRPMSLSPWAMNTENKYANGSVWISMKPKKIKDQYTKGAGTYEVGKTIAEFKFLAPLALSETISHNWESYESVSSRLAQKARSAVKLAAEGTALLNVGKNFLKESNIKNDISSQKGAKSGSTIEQYMTKAYNLIPGSKIPRIKVDTPLYYTNSQRRQIVLEFQLFYENVRGFKPEKILIEPIQELMKYSSPDLISEGSIKIEFPYMWEVKTTPESFINYPTCALIGVQPTWNSPYINGYPSSCNLQLTFIDLSPLYAGTIEHGSIINVKSGS